MRVWALFLLLIGAPAFAVGVDEAPLEDPTLEAEARAIMAGIRCLVCQNQSIEDSNADLAQDLRRIVRERLAAGDGRAEVEAYLVARYGDWILMRPPVNRYTALLWALPLLLLIGGGLAGGGLLLGFALSGPSRPERAAELAAGEGESHCQTCTCKMS